MLITILLIMRAHPHYNPFNVREPRELPVWQSIFTNGAPLDLEIGFSNGTWLLDYAIKYPQRNIIGVETRTKFIAIVKEKIQEQGLQNAYVVQANINTSLPKLFKDILFDNVFVFFPDPWYKPRHVRRRVVTADFIKEIHTYMRPSAKLHIATDQEFLAKDMLADLEASGLFTNQSGANNYAAENIPGITTDIEKYNIKKARPIYRLVFCK